MNIQPTTTINVGDTVIDVASADKSIQELVAYIDDWRQKEADATSQLLMIKGALRDIQQHLLTMIQSAQSAAEQPTQPADQPQ